MSDIQSASTSVESSSIASSSTESISAASTSTASTSSALASTSTPSTSASTSQYYNLYNVVSLGDVDCTTTDDSELSSDEESLSADDESANTNEVDCSFEQSDDNMDDKSYRSWSTTSSTVSVWRKSSSENSETEKSILKEWTPDKPSHNEDKFEDTTTTPILILVQVVKTSKYYNNYNIIITGSF